jgi:hypothetical protein
MLIASLFKEKNMTHSNKRLHGTAIVGIILICVGLVLMLQNFRMIDIGSVWSHWPMVFVIIGAVKLAQSEHAKHVGEGIWWIFMGLWLYVSIRHLFGLDFGDTWPALIIAWGVSIIWKSYVQQSYRLVKE